jgi:transcriptional regulator with XRE-family HTH domain
VPPTPADELSAPLSRFAANLRRARLAAKLSQEALAAEAGMHRTALSRLETCERAPEFRTLLRLARALGVTPASLLRGVR